MAHKSQGKSKWRSHTSIERKKQARMMKKKMPHKDKRHGETARHSKGLIASHIVRNVDYSSLDVSAELKKLFDYIDSYKSQDLELETRLKPFIPEYIPAVGDIDAFLKIPRPDSKPDQLGLVVLDEPSAKQTDPTGTACALPVLTSLQSTICNSNG